MSSQLITTIHIVSVSLFVLIYLIKTILIFANQNALAKFIKATRVIEMIVSTVFLVTGIWLFIILGAIKMLQIVKIVCVLIAIPLAVVGYKKLNKSLALISFLLIIAAYGLADMAKSKPFIPNNVVISGNADAMSQLGIKTYAANCAMCHGLDGKKQFRNAPDLSISSKDNTTIQALIRNGNKGENGVMPSFTGTLSDDEINAVSAYIVTLRH